MTARKKIRVGVVGFGWMGQAHTRSILRIPTLFAEREFDAELVMISDTMVSRVEQGVSDFGFTHGSVDWNDLVSRNDIDVVCICAPNMLHEPIAIAAAEAGKHVFCEKPVGGKPEQTVRIEAATRAAGVITGVGYNYRWAPLVRYAKQLIDAGELGEITNYRGRFFSMYGADPMGLLCVAVHARRGRPRGVVRHPQPLGRPRPHARRRDRDGWSVPATSRSRNGRIAQAWRHPLRRSAGRATRRARSRTRTTSGRCVVFENGARGVFESSRSIVGSTRVSARSRCTAPRAR